MKLCKARVEELETIYRMGFDTWGEDLDWDSYLKKCRHSPKYAQGTWYVLLVGKVPVASCLLYHEGFSLASGFVGIGSIATEPSKRGMGYASALVTQIVALQKKKKTKGIFLFSDIDPSFYEALGFLHIEVEDSNFTSACMFYPIQKHTEIPVGQIPSYF